MRTACCLVMYVRSWPRPCKNAARIGYATAKISRWSVGTLVKTFTTKYDQQLDATSNANRGFVVRTTLELMAAPLEHAIPGSDTGRSASVLQMVLRQNVEALQSVHEALG